MDDATTVQALKEAVRRFCEDRDWDQFHGAKDVAVGIITEAAELLEHFRFLSEAEAEELMGRPEDRGKVEDELADVFFFVLRFAQRYRIDLTAAFEAKMKRNAEKYPVEKAKGRNVKYTEL